MGKYINKYGEYALITGASSGIGREFATQLATKGLNLILVARRINKLDELAKELENKTKVKVVTIELDLLENNAIETLISKTKNLKIGLLIPNAGMEVHGEFVDNDYKKETNILKLNSLIPMQLAHFYGQKMKQQQKGGILFIASTFGHQSVPYFANYSASKAYILSIGQALNFELKKYGVDVTVLSPGLTKTAMVDQMTDINLKKMPIREMQVDSVVKKGLKSLGKRQAVIPGTRNIFLDAFGKYTTPRWMLTNMFGSLILRSMNK